MTSRRRTVRGNLTPEVIAEWEEINPLVLLEKHRKQFTARVTAIKLYALQESVAVIARKTGICRQELNRFVARVLVTNSEGEPEGFRALVPNRQLPVLRNTNLSKLKARTPLPGALSAVFAKYPSIHQAMRAAAIDGIREGIKHKEPDMAIAVLHSYFLEKCDEAGITYPHYPYVEGKDQPAGKTAIQRWSKKVRTETALHRMRHSNDTEERRAALGQGAEFTSFQRSNRFYKRLEFDGHSIDAPFEIEMPSPSGHGFTVARVDRIWIIAGIETKVGAGIGYSLALGKNYSSRDVVRAVQNCLKPWQKRKLTVSEIDYQPGDGIPSGVIPELAYACFDEISFDNAMAHRAEYLISFLERYTQTIPIFSPVAAPNTHPYAEGFFDLLEELGIHRMPTTHGSTPKDRKRKPKVDERYQLSYELLADLVDLLVCRINGSKAPGSQSRLELLQSAVKRRAFIPRHVPENLRTQLIEFDICEPGKIGRNHRRPVIRFEGARYDNKTLKLAMNLVGRSVTIFANSLNLQTIEVILDDGTPLGVMKVEPRWAATPHSLDVRREINRQTNSGSFVAQGDDIVFGFKRHLEKSARKSKKSARWLARMHIEEVNFNEAQSEGFVESGSDEVVEQDSELDTFESESDSIPDELKNLRVIYRGR